jgi:hypothetical protein
MAGLILLFSFVAMRKPKGFETSNRRHPGEGRDKAFSNG